MAQLVKNLPTNTGDLGSIRGLRRSLGEENGDPLQYSCLENPVDRGAWRAMAHRVKRSDATERPSLSLPSAACFLCGLEQGACLLPPSFWFAAQVLSLTFLLWEMDMIRWL